MLLHHSCFCSRKHNRSSHCNAVLLRQKCVHDACFVSNHASIFRVPSIHKGYRKDFSQKFEFILSRVNFIDFEENCFFLCSLSSFSSLPFFLIFLLEPSFILWFTIVISIVWLSVVLLAPILTIILRFTVIVSLYVSFVFVEGSIWLVLVERSVGIFIVGSVKLVVVVPSVVVESWWPVPPLKNYFFQRYILLFVCFYIFFFLCDSAENINF